MKCLIVEDDARIAGVARNSLKAAGFLVHEERDGNAALERILGEPFDVVILDIMLPGRDGLSILREMRARGVTTPVLILTARSGLTERVEGLDMGADDYLSKPYHGEELVARARALARRNVSEGYTLLSVGDLSLNLVTREVKRGGLALEFTNREFALLEYLMRKPGRVFSRAQICEHVWGYFYNVNDNLVEVYVKRLREKMEEGGRSRMIHTVRGIGYCLKEGDEG